MNQRSWTDPKETIVNPDGFERLIQQHNQKINNNEKEDNNGFSDTSNRQNETEHLHNMDMDDRNIVSNNNGNETPNKRRRNLIENDLDGLQSPKSRRVGGDFDNKNRSNRGRVIIHNQQYHHRNEMNSTRNKNQNLNQQQPTTQNNTNENYYRYNINEQSLSYSIDTHLTPITMECIPKINSKDTATKLVMLFFKEIEKDFRKQHPNHTRPIGFDHWWLNGDGSRIYGELKDVDLFVYLCDTKRYPKQLNNIEIIPDPPKRLPPQNTVVVKFVTNHISIEEFRESVKEKYQSTFAVENMAGAMRSNSRHIRIDFGEKREYESILNSGIIGVQGQLFDVDEYLPAPKILICTKCNEPGHTKKQCQLSFEKCRRCGKDRNDGHDHKNCTIKCQHCGNQEHCSNDYRCPSLLDFRRKIISELRKKPEYLPAKVQLFIPVDCRPVGNTNRILTNPKLKQQDRNYSSQNVMQSINEWPRLSGKVSAQVTTNTNSMEKNLMLEQTIKSFANEIAELKQKYNDEQQKIEQKFQEQLKNIQNGWIAMQNQIATQNEMITASCNIIEDTLFNSCQILINMVGSIVKEMKNNVTVDEEKRKIESIDDHITIMNNKLTDKKQHYYQYQKQLSNLMSQQRTATISIMNSLFSNDSI